MAEVIGIASGLVALTIFAFQSSVTLHEIITSLQGHTKAVRELRKELKAFEEVLQSLQNTVTDDSASLICLKLPLLRCGKACTEFKALILNCTTHSGGPKNSLRDWAKLKYMGSDISGFKDTLAGYKSTINIALGDANLRQAKVTASTLNEYRDLISDTKTDLEEHFQTIEERLKMLSCGTKPSVESAAEQERVAEERESTKQCLAICAEFSEHIDQVYPNLLEDPSATREAPQTLVITSDGVLPAKRFTANILKEFRNNIEGGASVLENRLHTTRENPRANLTQSARTTEEVIHERQQAEEEMATVTHSLAICARASEGAEKAQLNVFEDVHAAQSADQTIVATLGDLISAKRISAGVGATQRLGQMSDISLQHLAPRQAMAEGQRATEQQATSKDFKDQYGAGYRLNAAKGRD